MKLVFKGDSTTRSGYLTIEAGSSSSTSSIAISYFYNYFSGGSLRDSVESIPSAWDTKFMFAAEVTSSIDKGLAWCYPSTYTVSPFSIRLTAFDQSGTQVVTEVVTWDGHAARFISKYLPKLPRPFAGMVLVESQNYIYLEVLRIETTAEGFQLTSTPADDYVP